MSEAPSGSTGHPAAAPILFIGVLAISSAAIFIRLSEASALVTAFYRLLASSTLMWMGVSARRTLRQSRVPWRFALPAGAALAAHFWLWMRSLEMTSVLVSTLFVTTTSLWIALFAPFIPKEPRLTKRGWMGLSTALVGACLLAIADAGTATGGGRPLLGALLATGGAVAMAIYLTLSRFARATIPFLPYSAATTGAAALVLGVPVALVRPELTGFPTLTWVAIGAMALLPQVVGHNSLVWAVRFLGATTVALVVLLEPLASGGLAFLVFDERPTLLHAAASAVLLAGLTLVLRSRNEPNERASGS